MSLGHGTAFDLRILLLIYTVLPYQSYHDNMISCFDENVHFNHITPNQYVDKLICIILINTIHLNIQCVSIGKGVL